MEVHALEKNTVAKANRWGEGSVMVASVTTPGLISTVFMDLKIPWMTAIECLQL